MCVFTELYLGALPWSIYGDPLRGMVKVLGPLPQIWYDYCHQPAEADASWYDPSRQPQYRITATQLLYDTPFQAVMGVYGA